MLSITHHLQIYPSHPSSCSAYACDCMRRMLEQAIAALVATVAICRRFRCIDVRCLISIIKDTEEKPRTPSPASSVVAYYEAVREALLEVATSKRSQTVVLSIYSLYSMLCKRKGKERKRRNSRICKKRTGQTR